MNKNHLCEISGDKIRRQYFSWIVLIFFFCMFFAPFCILIISLYAGDFDLSTWLSDLLLSIEICLLLTIPFLILSALNRRFFGKIICVINENGIYYKDGLIKWNDIIKIEYELQFPGRGIQKESRFCHAVIYTKKDKIKLFHAPVFFISKVKKHQPFLDAKLSKNSKWGIWFFIILFVIIVLLFPLFT